jgi:integrase
VGKSMLTDAKVRAEKPAATVRKVSDGGGLQLWVTPTGVKTWRMAFKFDAKQRALSIGQYPAVSLSAARQARDAAKRILAAGGNPIEHPDEITIALDTSRRVDAGMSMREALSAATDAAKARADANDADTFGAIADELVEKLKREHRAEATLTKTKWLLDFARPDLGKKNIRSITAADVLDVLRKVEKRGRHETARRLRSTIGSVFRYAIATARAKDDPTIALQGALTTPKVKHRAAVTEAKAFGGLMRAIDGFDGQISNRAALQLSALLYPRPGELRQAKWPEFNFEEAIWTIPAERTKLRREHRKPLPQQAVSILKDLKEITGTSEFLFPCVRSWTRPISENTLNACLRRLGYSQDDATAHGFRATASTLLNESGNWSRDAIERELDHQEKDEVKRAYARGQHWAERVRMQSWWADFIDDLRAAGKVVKLRA